MPRLNRRHYDHDTPLSHFLRRLLRRHRLSQKKLAVIAGVSESVLCGWLKGAYPSERVIGVKRICDHFGGSLALALTGEPDRSPDSRPRLIP